MKRIKTFFKKADPVTFALIALLGVSAVFAWVQITGVGRQDVYTPVVAPALDEDTAPVFNPMDVPTVATPEVFITPVDTDDFNVTTTFFDETSEDVAALASSIFFFQVGNGKYSHPSQGVSFACEDDKVVNVVAPLSGIVSSVIDDDPVRGTIITIDHEEGLQTILTGVYNVTVTTGDEVRQGRALGVTGVSRLEPDSGNVVHLEVVQSGNFINPKEVIGRTISDL